MRKSIVGLWEGIPPGVAIAMLTIPAFILPFFWEHLTPLAKGAGISTVVLLVAVEISVIYRERSRQDQSFLAQLAKLDEIRRAYDAHSVALERVRNSVRTGSLRDRAFRLSESILEFVHERLENAPKMPTMPFVDRWSTRGGNFATLLSTDVLLYQHETLSIYLERFSGNVLGVIGEFESRNIVDDSLRNAANAPDGGDAIQFIGQRIGELAEDIKD